MYFLSDVVHGPAAFAEFLLVSGTQIEQLRVTDGVAAAELMNQYADTPMDFADATLVLAGEKSGILPHVGSSGIHDISYKEK